MWDVLIYFCCWQTSPSLLEVPYISVTVNHFQRFWTEPINYCVANRSMQVLYAMSLSHDNWEIYAWGTCRFWGWTSADGWTDSCVLLVTRWKEREAKSLSTDYNNISLCNEVALNITVSLALVLYVRIIAHNMHRHRLLLQACVLRRRRFYNRWQPETSPEVCFIVGRIIRALAVGSTGLVVVTLRSSVMQSHEPCCAAPSNGALGPHNVLILTQLSLRLINWTLRSKGGGGGRVELQRHSFLNFCTRLMWIDHFISGTQYIGSWLDPITGLDAFL